MLAEKSLLPTLLQICIRAANKGDLLTFSNLINRICCNRAIELLNQTAS